MQTSDTISRTLLHTLAPVSPLLETPDRKSRSASLLTRPRINVGELCIVFKALNRGIVLIALPNLPGLVGEGLGYAVEPRALAPRGK